MAIISIIRVISVAIISVIRVGAVWVWTPIIRRSRDIYRTSRHQKKK